MNTYQGSFYKLANQEEIKKLLQSRKQSFFMKKGIPYDIIEEYEDEGRFYVVGVSDDGEEATEEIFMPREKQMLGQQETEDRIAAKQYHMNDTNQDTTLECSRCKWKVISDQQACRESLEHHTIIVHGFEADEEDILKNLTTNVSYE